MDKLIPPDKLVWHTYDGTPESLPKMRCPLNVPEEEKDLSSQLIILKDYGYCEGRYSKNSSDWNSDGILPLEIGDMWAETFDYSGSEDD
jgi:hypothetical protein